MDTKRESRSVYQLIGAAMQEIGAVGKTATNEKQGYKYRGIDAIYNALNPVMAKYGLFICPEIIDQQREERTTQYGSVLIYTVLTVRYSVYAPDGSSISCTVVGEGMDSGDKSANKAMSAAMKYAMFQLFMIPTEDLRDSDAETPGDVLPKKKPAVPRITKGRKVQPAAEAREAVPPLPDPKDPVRAYIENEMRFMMKALGIGSEGEMTQEFAKMKKALIDGGVIPNIKSSEQTMEQAREMIDAIYKNFSVFQKTA